MRGRRSGTLLSTAAQNQEADALTSDDLTRFDERLRMRFDLSTFKGLMLSDMLACGTELHEEIRSAQRRKKNAMDNVAGSRTPSG